MNRADFMDQLESLLQSIAPTEREEAIQYYNDYFDDAGKENEREVIEALGNPARVAENIKRDLLGNGYGDKPVRKAQASDRALMEYGKEEQDGDGGTGQDSVGNVAGSDGQNAGNVLSGSGQEGAGAAAAYGQSGGSTATGSGQGSGTGQASYGQDSGTGSEKGSAQQTWSAFGAYGNSGQDSAAREDDYRWSHDTAGWTQDMPEKSPKGKMPVWAIALLVTVLIFASPVLVGVVVGVLGVVFGALAGWFGMIFGFGAATVVLLLMFLVLVVTGIICCFASPWVGMAMVGGGLICGCIGLLFLMLTVAMAGIATPAICKGIAWAFRAVTGRRRRAVNA